MADVSETGKEKIQTNDGKINIGITGNDINMKVPIDGEDRLKLSNKEFKVSQPGIDVTSATDQESIINKDNNVFKIVQTGVSNLTYTASDLNATVVINHNLGFVPIALVYNTHTSAPVGANNVYQLPVSPYYGRTGGFVAFSIYLYYDMSSSNLRITIATGTTSASWAGNWEFTYYLLQEAAQQ